MPAVDVCHRYQASHYTGGNGTTVVADVNGVLVSDNGSTLVLTISDVEYAVANDQWLVWSSSGAINVVVDIIPTTEYQDRYSPIQVA